LRVLHSGLTFQSCAEPVAEYAIEFRCGGTTFDFGTGDIRPREIAENKVLLCGSTPHEDPIIDAQTARRFSCNRPRDRAADG